MTKLAIKDLSVNEELGRKAMSEVRGGMDKYAHYTTMMPWKGGDSKSKMFSFDARQEINQLQDITANVGNNVAVLGGSASPHVNVTATQDADIKNRVRF